HRHAVRGRHAGGKGQSRAAPFERSQRGLKRLPRRIAAARIIVLSPLAGPWLHKRARQIERRHDRPSLRVVLLADVNGAGAKVHGGSETEGSRQQNYARLRLSIHSSLATRYTRPKCRCLVLYGNTLHWSVHGI